MGVSFDGPGVKRRQSSVQHRHASLAVDTDVGLLVAARGVRDRRQHQPGGGTIQTRQRLGQINRLPACQGCHDPQHPLLAARQRTDGVAADPGRVEPPHAGLVTRLDPRMTRCREPATREADQQLHRSL